MARGTTLPRWSELAVPIPVDGSVGFETHWRKLDELLGAHKLNDRVGAALFDVLLGLRVTRPPHVKLTELDERTATRDLVTAAGLGVLEARGERRGGARPKETTPRVRR